jgi:S-adenosylmethionine:tRNA ribosyltransferase-isomerase
MENLLFHDLALKLRPHDLLVFNNSRVIKARLLGRKPTGGQIEALVERVLSRHEALVQLKASKKPVEGGRLLFSTHQTAVNEEGATVLGRDGEFFHLRFDRPVLDVLEVIGRLPLPPYITHVPNQSDETRYQTIYAQHDGSVAAPTAGLHFDEALFAALEARGIRRAFVTLHVGAGTFQPVRSQSLDEHKMHSEHFEIDEACTLAIQRAQRDGGRVIAVGTTSLRSLESAAALQGRPPLLAPMQGDTSLFIRPGYPFHVVDGLITNFHLPKSTLLMLVSALAGFERIQAAYAHAIAQRYRFFSYGDAMFILRRADSALTTSQDRHA